MLRGDELRAALATIGPVAMAGYATRFTLARYAATALSPAGALRRGGRFNPPGLSALYTSLQRVTALLEATQAVDDTDPLPPYLMLTVEFAIDRILSLVDEATLTALQASRAELTARIARYELGSAPTQELGYAAAEVDFQAILTPSRPAQDGVNLVLLTDRLRAGDYVVYEQSPEPFDPETMPNVIVFPGTRRDG